MSRSVTCDVYCFFNHGQQQFTHVILSIFSGRRRKQTVKELSIMDVVRFSSGFLRHQCQLTNRKYAIIRTNGYRRIMINGYHDIHLNEGQTPYKDHVPLLTK